MSANDKQHGGDHYRKLAVQHWDYVIANNIPYMEACAIKYLTRWRDKGGVQDLHKAKHFIEKLIEVETARAGCGTIGVPAQPRYEQDGHGFGHMVIESDGETD